MTKLTTMCAAMAALTLAAAMPAHAVVYSLSGNWSDAANPNGVWAYGPGLSHYAQPTDGNSLNAAAANGYWGSGPTFLTAPFMLKAAVNGSATGAYTNNDFLAGDVLVHGPNDGSAVSITWTAPGAGTINLASSVWYAHSIVTRSEDITAFLNATALGAATVANGIDRGNALTLANGSGLAVAAGDVLRFNFAKSGGQTFGSVAGIAATIDFTPNATPAAVPEPATWSLMIAGFGLVGTAMRRRREIPATV